MVSRTQDCVGIGVWGGVGSGISSKNIEAKLDFLTTCADTIYPFQSLNSTYVLGGTSSGRKHPCSLRRCGREGLDRRRSGVGIGGCQEGMPHGGLLLVQELDDPLALGSGCGGAARILDELFDALGDGRRSVVFISCSIVLALSSNMVAFTLAALS